MEKCHYPDDKGTDAAISLQPYARRLLINQLRLSSTVRACPSSQLVTASHILEMVCSDLPVHKLEVSPHFQVTMVTELLHHFEQTACATLSNTTLEASFRKHKCPPPMLLDSALAFSALHLQTLYPAEVRFKLAATCMGITATQLFHQKTREGVPKSVRDMADLCSTYVILSALAFYLESEETASFEALCPSPAATGWLSMAPNFSTLLQQLGAPAQPLSKARRQLKQQPQEQSEPAASNDCKHSAFLPLLWDLCQRPTFSIERQEVYFVVVRRLAPILDHGSAALDFWELPADLQSVIAYTRLLHARDPVALLLLSYWLAALSTTAC